MALIFKYSKVPRPDGTLRNAPFIPISIRTDSGRYVKMIALVDSGADTTVIPSDLAELMGLNVNSKYEITGGIGGNVRARKSRMKFGLKGDHESYSLDVPVLVLEPTSDIPVILGRHGFFEKFHITFKQDEEKIVFKKITEKKGY